MLASIRSARLRALVEFACLLFLAAPAHSGPTILLDGIPLSYPDPPARTVIGEPFELGPTNANCSAEGRYQIENAPPWMSFDVSSGTLRGTPRVTDVGTFSDVRIFIRNGDGDVVLASFSVEVVTSAGTRGLRLSWTPPTVNSDGSTLRDLAGYRIYHGVVPGQIRKTVAVDNPGATDYVFDSLAPGVHYFAMTAINAHGAESDLSEVHSAALR
ncbi:MAG: putative Ig domain-containing protein [Gammaproteobacteria bacterium]